jgi:hypothetical protein
MAGIPQPKTCERKKNFRPGMMSQQIWRFIDNARIQIHMAALKPPATMKAPLHAHPMDEYMSFGVI